TTSLDLFSLMPRPPPRTTLFPYTTLFRSAHPEERDRDHHQDSPAGGRPHPRVAVQEHGHGQVRQRGDLRDYPAHSGEGRAVTPFARTALTAVRLVGLLAARAAAALPQFDLTKIPLTEAAFTRSIQVYQRAAAANPRDAEAHYWLGVAYWEASLQHRNMLIPYGDGYLDKSIAELERAVKID